MATAPKQGELGIGVGELLPAEMLRDGEDPFHSIIWFSADEKDAAAEFAAKYGYVTKDGVPL